LAELSSHALPDKRQVAASFSRAASSYDAVAELQRRVGETLLAELPRDWQPSSWLDLGCGTGHFSRALHSRFAEARGVALDIAEGMLRYARPRGGATHFVAGDAEALPMRTDSTDLIFSSLALQWCEDFSSVLGEAHRVLRSNGVFAFSSLCSGTLAELRDSWQRVDGFTHVNRFRSEAVYRALCEASGLQLVSLQVRPEVLYFDDLRQLTQELKALGAHNLNPGRPGGLTGRARVRALVAAYESFRCASGLPATYQAIYGVLRKRQ
jgi:malonyl-CoA O-methyltransferase